MSMSASLSIPISMVDSRNVYSIHLLRHCSRCGISFWSGSPSTPLYWTLCSIVGEWTNKYRSNYLEIALAAIQVRSGNYSLYRAELPKACERDELEAA